MAPHIPIHHNSVDNIFWSFQGPFKVILIKSSAKTIARHELTESNSISLVSFFLFSYAPAIKWRKGI